MKTRASLSAGLAALVLILSASAALAFRLPPPPNRGVAGNRTGAASRGTCADQSDRLTALVPEYSRPKAPTQVWGMSAAAQPILWFYQPYAKAEVAQIQVLLLDETKPAAEKVVYRATVPPADKPGIQSIALTNTPLTVNKTYHWYLLLKMNCTTPRPIFAEGWVQRSAIAQLPPSASQQLPVYAKAGLWYDMVTTLAQLQQQRPNDAALKQDWQNLLKAANLEPLATRPFVHAAP